MLAARSPRAAWRLRRSASAAVSDAKTLSCEAPVGSATMVVGPATGVGCCSANAALRARSSACFVSSEGPRTRRPRASNAYTETFARLAALTVERNTSSTAGGTARPSEK